MLQGGGHTGIHQDGNGIVDSGHYVAQGFNEVVMLTRLSESQKIAACQSLVKRLPNGNQKVTGSEILYTLPHDQVGITGFDEVMIWPTNDIIEMWEERG